MILKLFIFITLHVTISQSSFWSELADQFWYQCNIDIKNDISDLRYDLKNNVFGQPLVLNIVVNAIKGHLTGHPTKPLTLSFHGWPGSGKNYVADFIAKSMYKEGRKSKNVHYYIGKVHFPVEHEVWLYQKQLVREIQDSVYRCPQSLFIFDEVDKIPIGVLDAVKPFLDYRHHINRVDYRKSIFIFLSNIGSNKIIEKSLELWQKGVDRADYELRDFEDILTLEAFNDEGGGFYRSNMIESHLVDHYVPFLPLTRNHVQLCVRHELVKHGASTNDAEFYEDVLKNIPFGPDPEKLFSTSGCKRISQLVKTLLSRRRNHWNDEL